MGSFGDALYETFCSATKCSQILPLPSTLDWPVRANAASLRAVTAMHVLDIVRELMPINLSTSVQPLFD